MAIFSETTGSEHGVHLSQELIADVQKEIQEFFKEQQQKAPTVQGIDTGPVAKPN